MNFNTLLFAQFFAVIYLLYLAMGRRYLWQNRLLLIASYVFYCFWDWRFLSLIIISTIINYYCGIRIGDSEHPRSRKLFFVSSICFNLLLLGFFKYFNFFADNLQQLLSFAGWHVDAVTLEIILPLGISFYTFQAMSYPIDIYRGVIRPTRKFFDFALFIAFFPQLVAGPIERARNLIPQITKKRTVTLDKFYQGSWLIFWGLYKKIVIADNLAKVAAGVFGAKGQLSGLEVLIATYAFAIQIYADFSGYSDMARGIARLMGFEIMVNFRVPFFANNINDFWQRWHISLTTWVKEYLFYPIALLKIRGRQLAAPLVIIITWGIMGFWHGAAWKFVVWGVYHGILIVLLSKLKPYLKRITPKNRFLLNGFNAVNAVIIFHLFCVGIICFAAGSMSEVMASLSSIFFNFDAAIQLNPVLLLPALFLVPLVIIEFAQYRNEDEMAVLKWPLAAKAGMYYFLLYTLILYGDFSAQKYYYFQF